jgi:hypothetical protein
MLLLVIVPAAAASGWSIEATPNPNLRELHGVSCAAVGACTAVGEYFSGHTDVTLAERWNGTRWAIQHTLNPAGGSVIGLRGVSCASARACTAVGEYISGSTYVPLAERWNGTRWSIQHTSNPAGGSSTFLDGVSCPSTSACTAVGQYNNGTTDVMLAERWNGTRWSIQHTPNPVGGSSILLYGVSCPSTRACTAVGQYNNGAEEVTLAERWNGATWSIQHTANPTGGSSNILDGVSCPSTSACTAVGAYSNGTISGVPLAERWNGTRWSIQHTPSPTGGSGILDAVSCPSTGDCTAVGHYPGGANEVTLAERWNGTSWSIQRTPNPAGASTNQLFGVGCASTGACTAVGASDGALAERWKR